MRIERIITTSSGYRVIFTDGTSRHFSTALRLQAFLDGNPVDAIGGTDADAAPLEASAAVCLD